MKEVGGKAVGWHALVVSLSRLPASNTRSRLAPKIVERIEASVHETHGTITLPNFDICVLIRDPKGAVTRELALLLNEFLTTSVGPKAWSLIRVFNLEINTSDFIAIISGVDKSQAKPSPLPAEAAPSPEPTPLDLAEQNFIENTASAPPASMSNREAAEAAIREFVGRLKNEATDNMVSLKTIVKIGASIVDGLGLEASVRPVEQAAPTIQTTLPPAIKSALTTGVRQLDSAIKEQEQAVGRILGLVEMLMARATDIPTSMKLEGVIEVCSFQDLTGQRIRKVGRLLRFLVTSKNLGGYGTTVQNDLVESHGLTQSEVDRLLNGG